MKKISKILIITIISLILLTGCSKLITNEIYNKSYNIGEISITEFEDLVVAVVEKASPAVIGVTNYTKSALPGIYSVCCTGSGAIYKGLAHMKNGDILLLDETIERTDVQIYEYFFFTNRHVVFTEEKGLADKIEVFIGEDDVSIIAQLIQYDPQVDLAIGKFEHSKYIQPLKFADSDQLKAGKFAIAIGSPSGLDYYSSVTFGIISFPKRYIAEKNSNGISEWDAEYIQHDVAINPGNSGGPLINMSGEIIGINTMKFVSNDIDNMGFSIPSNLVSSIIPTLEQGKQPVRAKLGIQAVSIRDLDDQGRSLYNIPEEITSGIYVDSVIAGGVASKANLQHGDIILAFEGTEIRHSYEIRAILNRFSIGSGQVAELKIYRNGTILIINITF